MASSTHSNVVTIDPSELEGIVKLWNTGQVFRVATVALLVYDTVVTFDKEVKYFWKLPRRPVDFVYFVNRYVGILGAVASLLGLSFSATLQLCNFSQWTIDIAGSVTVISIDYILTIRVLALYSQDKTLSTCLKALLALEAAFKVGMIVYLDKLEHIIVGIVADSDISVCGYITALPWRLGMADWLVPVGYGTLLMVLALYKAAEHWRASADYKLSTLVKVIIEGQIVYFALTISCSVFAILEFRLQLANQLLAVVLNQLGNTALLSLLGSRMLFNLKEAGERGQNEGTSYGTPSSTMSEMDFAEPVNPPQRESGAESSGGEQMA